MGRGYTPETCTEAIRWALGNLGNRASAEAIFNAVRSKGHWTDETIWSSIENLTVNCPPAYRHSGSGSRFLFLREDGNYELYQQEWHGRYERGKRIV